MTHLGRVTKKEEDGKLYAVDVKCEGQRIESVKISGEFFANPEGLIESMEESLRGIRLDRMFVMQAIAGALFYSKGTLVGIRASDLVEAIVEAGGKP